MSCRWLLLFLAVAGLSTCIEGEPLPGPYASSVSQSSYDMALLRRTMRQGTDCDSQENVRDLCQRCATATKSPRAYPLCCYKLSSRSWCSDFLNYGLGA